MMRITALMPLKKESERLKQKNIRLFCGKPLFYYVLETLHKSKYIDDIIINTDCEVISSMIAKDFPDCIVLHRPQLLFGNHIVMNQLIEHDIVYAKNEHILQTHSTNPLLTVETINNAISLYFHSLLEFDSLFTVDKVQARLYDESGNSINHHLGKMEMTQNMKPIFKENSSIFLFSKTIFSKTKSRIGLHPKFYEMNELESIDIDYEDDFKLAELLFRNRSMFKNVFFK
jgi:CMP-N-acetylneuraminic acid synthetase